MPIREVPTRAAMSCAAVCCLLCGCATKAENIGLAVTGVTALAAQSPTSEIENIYYLGVFDPQDQVPSAVYRVRVHVQASAISTTRFASGWVRAELVDSLNSGARFASEGGDIVNEFSNSISFIGETIKQ